MTPAVIYNENNVYAFRVKNILFVSLNRVSIRQSPAFTTKELCKINNIQCKSVSFSVTSRYGHNYYGNITTDGIVTIDTWDSSCPDDEINANFVTLIN